MKREIITIENGIVYLSQSGDIQMTAFEIAALFEIYVQTINTGIKTILKSDIVKVDISCPVTVVGNTLMPDFYNLEMITALAFRIKSYKAEIFRDWLIRKALANTVSQQILMSIQWDNKALLN
jgi:hypothetical protein